MLSVSFKHSSPIYFRGYQGSSKIQENGVEKEYNHYTEFMRNFPTMEFAKDYAVKNFPYGTNITEFGPSQGQNLYSYLILLDQHNKDKKYKATGYDISPKVIELAKAGLYKLNRYNKNEQILFATPTPFYVKKTMDEDKSKPIREKFFEYFQEVKFDEKSTSYASLKNLATISKDSVNKLEYKRMKAYLEMHKDKNEFYVAPRPEKVKDILDLKFGDIRNIDKILEPEKSGVVIFQNALYHIMDSMTLDGYNHVDIKPVQEIFEKINKVLPKNGIFVMGNLIHDHLYDSSYEPKTRLAHQNNEIIRVFDSSKVHEALKKSGFEPIFYEKASTYPFVDFKDVYLPSEWKKVSHLK